MKIQCPTCEGSKVVLKDFDHNPCATCLGVGEIGIKSPGQILWECLCISDVLPSYSPKWAWNALGDGEKENLENLAEKIGSLTRVEAMRIESLKPKFIEI